MIATRPPDVSFFWDERQIFTPLRGTTLKKIAVLLLRSLGLPNLRFVRKGAVNHIDVIHSCQNLLLARQPWVVDIEHGCPFVGVHFSRLQNPVTLKLIQSILASRFCGAILPWTNTAAKAFLRIFDPNEAVAKKLRVVYPAVQPQERINHDDHPAEIQLLFVANQPEWNFFLKGGRELIEAYRILRSKGKNLSLVVIGPVPSNIVSDYRRVPGISLPGKVSRTELYELYRQSAIYVMPSFSDTFGMVFLEAMAFSLPIVTLNKAYTQEIVRDGETGLLVDLPASSIRWFDPDGGPMMNSDTFIKRIVRSDIDVGVVEGLVEKIGFLIEDPKLRNQLASNGYEEVSSGRFSVAHRNKLLRQIYMEAATIGSRGLAV
jgi:glycosyltransferase involved in cell wall biosynthesis